MLGQRARCSWVPDNVEASPLLQLPKEPGATTMFNNHMLSYKCHHKKVATRAAKSFQTGPPGQLVLSIAQHVCFCALLLLSRETSSTPFPDPITPQAIYSGWMLTSSSQCSCLSRLAMSNGVSPDSLAESQGGKTKQNLSLCFAYKTSLKTRMSNA